RDLRKALELNPQDPDLYNHLGYSLLLWYGSARVDEAEELVRKALDAEPDNPAYIDSMGWVYYMKGDYEKAILYLLDALRRAYDDPVVHEHVGDVLLKMGYVDEAKKYFKAALRLLDEGKEGERGQRERILKKLEEL
ncbi:MAG TPA: tetratricopeptide repeat protein, partial [Aquifex aeolicus]|nr:tetratricopeptide repeat protein [Aquifex aeolicus]